MKKILALFIGLGFVACETRTEDENTSANKDSFIGRFLYPNYDFNYDEHLLIVNTDIYLPEIAKRRNEPTMYITSSLRNVGDFGQLFVNDIQLDDKYCKDYNTQDINEKNQMESDLNKLFGNKVTLKGVRCRGNDYCNIDYTFQMPYQLDLKIEGTQDLSSIYEHEQIVFSWSAQGKADDVVGVYVYTPDRDLKKGDRVPQLLKTGKNSDGSLQFSGKELSSVFRENENLYFMIFRGNHQIYTTQAKKKLAVQAVDIVKHLHITFKK